MSNKKIYGKQSIENLKATILPKLFVASEYYMSTLGPIVISSKITSLLITKAWRVEL